MKGTRCCNIQLGPFVEAHKNNQFFKFCWSFLSNFSDSEFNREFFSFPLSSEGLHVFPLGLEVAQQVASFCGLVARLHNKSHVVCEQQ